MYMYMSIYMYIKIAHIFVYHPQPFVSQAQIGDSWCGQDIITHTHTHTHTHISISISISISIYIDLHVCIHLCIYVYTYKYM